ncbi:MAG: GNAT family N-acetyltransferase [bacterium]|nr:GNAT family N-acetyltransferase [bacterium]
MNLNIQILKKPTPQALKNVNFLMRQISLTKIPPKPLSTALFKDIINQDGVNFITVSKSDGEIVAILILYFVRIPSGLTAILEDLIVDEKYHKWGIGRLLVEKAIEIAKNKKARHLSLRTNPIREEANKLYQAMGFNIMKTNFYRLNLFK